MTELNDVLGIAPDMEPFKMAMARLAERNAKQQADRNELNRRQNALINSWQPVITRVANSVNPELRQQGHAFVGVDSQKLQSDGYYSVVLFMAQNTTMSLNNGAKTYPTLNFSVRDLKAVHVSASNGLDREIPWMDAPSDLEIEKVLAEYAYGCLTTD